MKTFATVSALVFTAVIAGSAFACDTDEVKYLQALYQTSKVVSLGVSAETGRYKIIYRDGRILYVETGRSSGTTTIRKQIVLSNQ